MTFTRRALLIAILLLGITAPCFAQAGLPPFAAFSSGPDQIDLGNLNIHITTPLESSSGRGLPFVYNFSFDNSIWTPSGGAWLPAANFGFTGGVPAWNGVLTYSYSSGCQSYPYVGTICWSSSSNYVYTDANGTVHAFTYWQECSSGCASGGSTVAADGSGYALYGGGVATPSGIVILPGNSGSMTDTNGNHINSSTNSGGYTVFTDTKNLSPLSINPYPNNNQTGYGVSGQTLYLIYQNFTVRTNFGCSGVSEFGPKTESLPIGMSFGDGTGFGITYEQTPGYPGDITGRIAKLTLRTGGQINYTYPSANDGIICSDGSTAGFTRQTPDGSWNYTRSENGTAWTTTIVDPQSNKTVMNFQGIYPTETQVSSSSGTLLKTAITCYNGTAPSGTPATCNSAAITLPITQKTVYTQWPSGSSLIESEINTLYNAYGLVTELDEYGYGTGQPGSVVRKTLTSYASLGNGIVNRPSTVTVEDGSNNVKAQTTHCYDEATPSGTATCNSTGSPTATSGTPQHNSVTGSRGNPTTIAQLVSGSATLGQKFSYYDTGTINVATDVNGAQTTSNYSNTTSTCGNTFATSVSEPLGLTTSTVWNCSNGSPTSVTDENNATTSYGYSSSNSAYCSYYPAGCLSGVTDPLGNFTQITTTGQTSTETSLIFNGSNSTVDLLTTADGLGRPHLSQTKESPSSSTYDSVETDYDSLGRPSSKKVPYAASAGQVCSGTCPAVAVSYDALNRPTSVSDAGGGTLTYTYSQNDILVTVGPAPSGENTKRKQLEYDALGRLTSVCEITSAAGSGTCGQTSAMTGYWTKYSYDLNNNPTGVTQNAQSTTTQTRSYAYDALGRMTSETNPETSNVAVTYTYDTDSTCGASKGDLVKEIDAVGNTICFAYDALHRMTSATYPSGSYASVTPSRYFVYDSGTVNGVAMSNAKTRMAEAYTCASCPATKLTDEGFSYTARGEVSDVYQLTPHSGGYYHVYESYWANGAVNQMNAANGTQPVLPGLPTITYGVDGEGRPYSASASLGQNPLSSTTYSVASLPTAVKLGSSDSDSFTYDPSTNRMTQYKFTINSQSVIGNLTWNPLGTLGILAVADPFNGANAQTCTYTHDDLARIGSTTNPATSPGVNCVNGSQQTVWSQDFSFDPFGNINKSGNSSFGATYSSSTNHMTQIGSSTPTYDSNGNVTNDFLNNYAWDANGRPVTADTVGLTYDALGSMVEQNRGGVYTQIVYAPTGAKLALMNVSTLQKGFVPLTGGSMAVYNSTTLDHYRHSDWLRSNRLCSSPSQTVTCDAAYGPYGETYAPSGSADPSFTGMNQDTAPNLYDFPAREYGIQGRWPSPDPAGVSAVNPSDPQTWNRYAYVRNSPLMMVDPLGLDGMDYYDCEETGDDCGLLDPMSLGGLLDPMSLNATTTLPQWVPTPWQPGCWTDTVADSVTCFPWQPQYPTDPTANCFYALVIPCGGIPGGGAGPQPTKPTQQQCEAAARAKAKNSRLAALGQNFHHWGVVISEGVGGGAVAGCIFTSEIGCFEGGAIGAVVGGQGGNIIGGGEFLFNEGANLFSTHSQEEKDLAACRQGS
jgi:RHS repeat-associated protein